MNINISERALRWFDSVKALMEKIDLDGEIDYHIKTYGSTPKKITIIRYYEDNNKLNPSKKHLILYI